MVEARVATLVTKFWAQTNTKCLSEGLATLDHQTQCFLALIQQVSFKYCLTQWYSFSYWWSTGEKSGDCKGRSKWITLFSCSLKHSVSLDRSSRGHCHPIIQLALTLFQVFTLITCLSVYVHVKEQKMFRLLPVEMSVLFGFQIESELASFNHDRDRPLTSAVTTIKNLPWPVALF